MGRGCDMRSQLARYAVPAGMVAGALCGVYLVWFRRGRHGYRGRASRAQPAALNVDGFSGIEAAAYAAQLADLYERLTSTSSPPLAALYEEAPRIDAPPLWRDPFGQRILRGCLAPEELRSFATRYRRRYGHSLAEVAAAARELERMHSGVWRPATERLAPEGDVCDALARMYADMGRMAADPPLALDLERGDELREALAPVRHFTAGLLHVSLHLKAVSAHLTLLELRVAATGEMARS